MQPDGPDQAARRESPAEALDRNWNELLQEVRVLQTGVQILGAFLLTIPFQQRFAGLTREQHALYLALLVLTGVTTGLLIAPVSWHRILFRQGRKADLVRLANGFVLAGLAGLITVLSGAVALVFDVVSGRGPAIVAGLVSAVLLFLGWFVAPRAAQRGAKP